MSDGDNGKNIKRGRKTKVESCLKSKGEREAKNSKSRTKMGKVSCQRKKKVTKKLSTKKSQKNQKQTNQTPRQQILTGGSRERKIKWLGKSAINDSGTE